MHRQRALLIYEPTLAADLVRSAILSEGCGLEETVLSIAPPRSIEPYSLVVVEIARFGSPIINMLRDWREDFRDRTVILIGSRTTLANRLAVLEAGVSAYLTKPVVIAELTARIRAALRQGRGQRSRLLALGGCVIDFEARAVRSAGGRIRLTPTECSILNHLVEHINQTVPCGELVKALWGEAPQKGAHSLRIFIRKLRTKLEPDPSHPTYLLTDPAVGYRLQLPSKGAGVAADW